MWLLLMPKRGYVSALKVYTVWRVATVRQFKEVRAEVGLDDDQVLDIAAGVPWNEAKVIDTDGEEVEA